MIQSDRQEENKHKKSMKIGPENSNEKLVPPNSTILKVLQKTFPPNIKLSKWPAKDKNKDKKSK